MPYERTEWKNGETKLNATNMNNIENGIYNAQQTADSAQETATTAEEIANNADLTAANKVSSIVAGLGIKVSDDGAKNVTINVDNTKIPVVDTLPDIDKVLIYSKGANKWDFIANSTSATAYTIAQRGANGVMLVGTPTANEHATTKKYVDDGLSGRQATLTAGDGISLASNTVKITDNVARTTSTDLGTWIPVQTRPTGPSTWSDVKVSADGAESDSIVKRTSTGQVFVAAPTENLHASTKKYVDDKVATKQNTLTAGNGISITGNSIAIDDSVAATKAYVQTAYKAGSNVTISDPDASGIRTISATGGGGGGASYTAGTGIDITGTEISVSDTVAMKADVTTAVSGKQDKLTAGTGITLTNNTVAIANTVALKTDVTTAVAGKQDTITAGKGISLSGSTLSVNDDVATIETYQDGDYIPVCTSGAWLSTGVLATQGADANAVAIRRNSGALLVPTTPTDDNEAASKAYVDGKIGVTYSAGTGISISASNAISVDTNTIATKSEVNDVSTGLSGVSTQVNEIQTGLSTVSTQVNNLSGTYTLIENDVAYTSTLAVGDEYEFGLWAPHIQDDGTATITVGTTTLVAASIAQEDGALTGKITVVSTNESDTAGNGLFYTLVYAGTCKTGFISAAAGQTLSLTPHAGGPVGTAKRSYVIKTTRTLS